MVLFNDTLYTFYLWHQTYGKGPLGKRGNPLLSLLLPISSKGSFYMHHPTEGIAPTAAFITHGALAGTRNSSMCMGWEQDIAPWSNVYSWVIGSIPS